MPKPTHGHGNPDWTFEETILALEFLQRYLPGYPPKSEFAALSKTLRSLNVHPKERRGPTFRNADGVGFKVLNLRSVYTGKGLKNVSSMDRTVWTSYGHRPDEVRKLADAIRAGSQIIEEQGPTDEVDDEEESFAEGRFLTRVHKRRERNPKLRKAKIASAIKQNGRLSCECCGFAKADAHPDWKDAAFEVHHVVPVASTDAARKVTVKDVVVLCANCHRFIHKLSSLEGTWLSVADLAQRMRTN